MTFKVTWDWNVKKLKWKQLIRNEQICVYLSAITQRLSSCILRPPVVFGHNFMGVMQQFTLTITRVYDPLLFVTRDQKVVVKHSFHCTRMCCDSSFFESENYTGDHHLHGVFWDNLWYLVYVWSMWIRWLCQHQATWYQCDMSQYGC